MAFSPKWPTFYRWHFVKGKEIQILLMLFPRGPIDSKSPLIRRSLVHVCVTRSQCVSVISIITQYGCFLVRKTPGFESKLHFTLSMVVYAIYFVCFRRVKLFHCQYIRYKFIWQRNLLTFYYIKDRDGMRSYNFRWYATWTCVVLSIKNVMMTSSNGNIFRVTGHLCGEFTGPRWIPHTKASDAELWR